jgi:acyl transferase domain-containing protein
VPLPGYPFERRRHWIEAVPAGRRSADPAAASPAGDTGATEASEGEDEVVLQLVQRQLALMSEQLRCLTDGEPEEPPTTPMEGAADEQVRRVAS